MEAMTYLPGMLLKHKEDGRLRFLIHRTSKYCWNCLCVTRRGFNGPEVYLLELKESYLKACYFPIGNAK